MSSRCIGYSGYGHIIISMLSPTLTIVASNLQLRGFPLEHSFVSNLGSTSLLALRGSPRDTGSSIVLRGIHATCIALKPDHYMLAFVDFFILPKT